MKRGVWWIWVPLLGSVLACNALNLPGLATPAPLPTIAPITPTPSATAQAAAPVQLAWVSNNSLNITNFTAQGVGATSHLPFAAGGLPSAHDLAWSPLGQSLAVSSYAADPELYKVELGGTPTLSPLGTGARPAWSPDGTTLVAERNNNLWLIRAAGQTPLQLTNQEDWQWGNPVFTPDGQAIIVAGAAADLMGAQGNVEYYLYRLPLDGTGALTQLPGLGNSPFFGRLPYDLQLSPDGQRLAFSTSAHLSACASPTVYYVGSLQGTDWREVASATINAALDSAKEVYQQGQGLTWMPDSSAVVLDSLAWDCSAAQPGPVVGPLLSVVGLDGVERTSFPLNVSNPTVDVSGQWLAGLVYPSDGSTAQVEVYSLVTGETVADLGEGIAVKFGP